MIGSISWKNIWRSRMRSLVVITAITLGLLGGIFSASLMEGMGEQRIDAAVSNESSDIQLHHPDYMGNNEAKYTIKNPYKIKEEIEKIPGVVAVSVRKKFFTAANSTAGQSGMILIGIDTAIEKSVSKIHKRIIDSAGTYFNSKRGNQIVIGEKMANNLKLINYKMTDKTMAFLNEKGIDEELIEEITFLKDSLFRSEGKLIAALQHAIGEDKTNEVKYYIKNSSKIYKMRAKINVPLRDKDGHNAPQTYKIAGIYKTSNGVYDGLHAFTLNKKLEYTGYGNDEAHEIAVLLDDHYAAKQIAEQIKKKYPELTVETWTEISPELGMLTEYMGLMNYIFIVVILFSLAFGIINTMLMSVLERVEELGMLMAIGMNRLRVFLMIMLETVMLSLTGGVVGVILSSALVSYLNKAGLDFSTGGNNEMMESLGYASVVYPQVNISYYFGVTGLVILTGILSAIYPAIKALGLNPADAIRTE